MASYDLVIKFPHEKDKERCVYTKRDFLTAHSAVFRNIVYEDPFNPKTEIELTDINSMTMYHALQCISTSGKSLASERLAVLLRRFARKYEMTTLNFLCESFLIKRISIENAEVIHDLACHFSDTHVQFYCWLKFDTCWREIFSKASFYQCSESTMRTFVSRPVYKDLDEFFLWNALYTWGLTKMVRGNSVENPVLHRKILEEFLPHIRFLVMKPEELNVIFNCNVLTSNECHAIKHAYETKDVSVLPQSICSIAHPRTAKYLSQYVSHAYSHFCPKHTKLRQIQANDNFHAEFVPSHDCFLVGFILPVIVSEGSFPLVGHIEISTVDTATNKREDSLSWNLTIKANTIRLFPPVFIGRNWRASINLSVQSDNLQWHIEYFAKCDIGHLDKQICNEADSWKSFYFKESMLYF